MAAVASCLSGCGLLPGNVPSSPPAFDEEAQEQVAADCLDLWLNTEAPRSAIDNGMASVDTHGLSMVIVVTQNEDGRYHAETTSPDFTDWAMSNNVPWATITSSIDDGVGCPYEPSVKAELDQKIRDCFDTWVNDDASQSVIDAGLATTAPDGTPVSDPALVIGADGRYHVDTASDWFTTWATANYMPREYMTSSIRQGRACPYDLPSIISPTPSGR